MLIATLLAAPPPAELLRGLGSIPEGEGAWGAALNALSAAARAADAYEVEREFNRLFIGLQRGELLPYASFYITGFLHDRPLVALRDDMVRLGIARAPGVAEPEDHIAGILEIMAGLIEGRFGASLDAQTAFFRRHLAPWASRCFADLERAESADFYRHVAVCGRVLMDIEAEAAALT